LKDRTFFFQLLDITILNSWVLLFFSLRFEIYYIEKFGRRSGNMCNKTWVPAVPTLANQSRQSL